MPTGKTFIHPRLGSLFVHGEDGKYYQPRPEVELEPDTAVTFDVLNLTGAPPGFYFAGNVKKVVTPPSGSNATGNAETVGTPPKALGAWAKPIPTSVLKVDAPKPVVQASTKPAVSPALPLPGPTPRTLTERSTREDFEAIAAQVSRMDWGRQEGFGPSLQVTTPLKWEGEGIELYMRVHEEYQDRKIPGTRLYYFVGTMGVNYGKGGFRISAHTHPKASIGKSKTYTVLHIEN